MSPHRISSVSKGASEFATWGIAMLLLLAVVLFLFNTIVLKGQLPFGKSNEAKVTSPTEASQKTSEIGKDLQDVSSAIENIERRLG
ncbi:MAG: hypothetical protein HYW24_02690 [Candidatus Aenigmarchaeota archaeon]|nr:hypothetical protein [Candidatus Aenigmarchaeota archaeon]